MQHGQHAAQTEIGPLSGATRVQSALTAGLGCVLVALALGWILGVPRWFGWVLFDEQVLALALGLALGIVGCGLWAARSPLIWAGIATGAALLAAMAVLALRYPDLMMLSMRRPLWLVATCAAVLVGLNILVWRSFGAAIVGIVAVFSGLALYGAAFGIPPTAPQRFAIYMVTDPNALIGLPLRVAVQIVIPFILLGELLRQSGGSAWLTRLCLAAFGPFRGGSAQAAVAASALFGTMSGNAVSNVAGTGIVTIPLMKRTGLRPETAAAVEAVASTGGQLLPPVMGTAAFVMADTLQVPYLQVMLAALLPAILYYAALVIQIDRISARNGIGGVRPEDRPRLASVRRAGWHFTVPFGVLFVLLALNQTQPEVAALGACASLLALAMVVPFEGRRLGLADVAAALVATGRAAAPLLLVTAAAGLVIGLISLTGLGYSIAASAVAASGGNLVVLLVLVALIAIVFGMGMPTVAVYVVLSTVLAPALVQAGLAPMQAHLFILYFGLLSMLTPPVALASITAARIAGTDMWRTSFRAMKLAWTAYVIPFLFTASPELLLGQGLGAAMVAGVTAFLGIAAISVAVVGFARASVGGAMRLVYAALGLVLLMPPGWGPAVIVANVGAALVFIGVYARSAAVRAAPIAVKS